MIIKNLNFWEHLKNSIGENTVPKIASIKKIAPDEEDEEISELQIINELGLDSEIDFLDTDNSSILLSAKTFKPDMQSIFKQEIEKSRDNLNSKISESVIIKTIDDLIRELEKSKTEIDKISEEAAKSGRNSLSKELETFKPSDTEEMQLESD